jgi:hypothetical protein
MLQIRHDLEHEKSSMPTISFKPKQVTKRLLASLPPRARDVITARYGMGESSKHATLESIGKKYGITRERVRQIENYALNLIQKSDAYADEHPIFSELVEIIESLGGIVSEDELLDKLAKNNETSRNHIHFLLVVGNEFKRGKEDGDYALRWYVDESLADQVHDAVATLYSKLDTDELVAESEMVNMFLDEVKNVSERYRDEEIIRRWLSLSKKLGKNPLGEWGASNSPNVKVKGMRDYAYLAIKKHGSPMHFTEIARAIKKLFDKEAHVATCHNELIKNKQFVLVGRGLYALSEWGYSRGIVKEVIRDILEKGGPLTREEIIDRVRRERHVKDNTIVVNLQNTGFFKRMPDGRYSLVNG